MTSLSRTAVGSRRPANARTAPVTASLMAWAIFALAAGAGADRAAAGPAALCDRAAARAAAETGVPLAVLRAITRTETGRTIAGDLSPWPWTVNMQGEGRWFETRDAARRHAERHAAAGARSFDIGCFQINHRWHGAAFESIAAMFDPLANARYAAGFLARLHAETGDWTRAAGAYHSRTPELARRYTARFERIYRATARAAPVDAARTRDDAPRNGFPLLRPAQRAGAFGSLVPLGPGARPALIPLGNAGGKS